MPVELILRPDLPQDIYPLRWRLRVARTASPSQRQRALREQGQTFIRYVRATDGYEFRQEYGWKLLGGPYPVIRPRPLPKPKAHGRLQKGPHERGLDDLDVSYVVETEPLAFADEWEWEIGGYFTRTQIQMEVLSTDIPRLEARRNNGR